MPRRRSPRSAARGRRARRARRPRCERIRRRRHRRGPARHPGVAENEVSLRTGADAQRHALQVLEDERREKEIAAATGGAVERGWGTQIRSYVFYDNRVKDHRTGHENTGWGELLN